MTYKENERLAALETKVDSIQGDIAEIRRSLEPLAKYIIADAAANDARDRYATASRKFIIAAVGVASGVVTILVSLLSLSLH